MLVPAGTRSAGPPCSWVRGGRARPSTGAANPAAGRGHPAPRPVAPVRKWVPVVLSVVVAAFVLILPVELPDKTLFATLVLATRFQPLPVFVGVGLAFAVQSLVAVTAGSLLGLLPHYVVTAAVALLFLVGAVVLWRSARNGPEEEEIGETPEHPPFWRAAAVSCGVPWPGPKGSPWPGTTRSASASTRSRWARSWSASGA